MQTISANETESQLQTPRIPPKFVVTPRGVSRVRIQAALPLSRRLPRDRRTSDLDLLGRHRRTGCPDDGSRNRLHVLPLQDQGIDRRTSRCRPPAGNRVSAGFSPAMPDVVLFIRSNRFFEDARMQRATARFPDHVLTFNAFPRESPAPAESCFAGMVRSRREANKLAVWPRKAPRNSEDAFCPIRHSHGGASADAAFTSCRNFLQFAWIRKNP